MIYERECTDCYYNEPMEYDDPETGEHLHGTFCSFTGSMTGFFGHEPDCPVEEKEDEKYIR